MPLIASSIPGRLRLRDRALRNPARLEDLRRTVARWRGVEVAEANPLAGSLLLRYDPARLPQARIEARIAQLASKSAPVKSPAERPAPARHGGTPRAHAGGTLRVRTNRWAKRGMLLSLAISLLLAGAGRKRWHALAGGLFLASLAVHLWAQRRHILR